MGRRGRNGGEEGQEWRGGEAGMEGRRGRNGGVEAQEGLGQSTAPTPNVLLRLLFS